MPAFEYEAIDAAGKKSRGYLSADSEIAARRELRRRRLSLLSLGAARSAGKARAAVTAFAPKALPSRELMLVTRQLASLIGAGMPVEEAVGMIAGQGGGQATRRVLTDVRARIVEGERLSEAMTSHRASFPDVYRAMVAAGEMSGGLAQVLERLADYLEKSQALKRKLQTALVYPAALSVTALVVVGVLMVFIVPRIAEQFDGTGVTLPLLTRTLIGVSGFLQMAWPFLLIGAGVLVAAVLLLLRRRAIRVRLDALLARMPVVGGAVRKTESARFARTMDVLLGSGAILPDALKAAREAAGNHDFRSRVAAILADVESGRGLADAMKARRWFPPLMLYMVAAGERSGTLGDMFARAADQLEQDIEGGIVVALSLVEPAIIIVMGVIVTGIVLSILLPILQLNSLALG
ncbi:type II secretion system inner membrane protein GspF [Hyphobacterium marinum]|uniref:General secretion pathway protein F n=1 Tax=Hyphobacterium marinum TaxID=3116574 RepID=A0ABU7LW48_9PROT|nr:type II secretion system inner membrane protein GspF [Hyphobacterium sp. Y6023]MEE2565760.1 type II secretion system inner membrane protein GspF [Hyphobacterium sp. Y6023]